MRIEATATRAGAEGAATGVAAAPAARSVRVADHMPDPHAEVSSRQPHAATLVALDLRARCMGRAMILRTAVLHMR